MEMDTSIWIIESYVTVYFYPVHIQCFWVVCSSSLKPANSQMGIIVGGQQWNRRKSLCSHPSCSVCRDIGKYLNQKWFEQIIIIVSCLVVSRHERILSKAQRPNTGLNIRLCMHFCMASDFHNAISTAIIAHVIALCASVPSINTEFIIT